MPGTVRYEREGAIALLTISNPPVNAASHAVRAGLLEAAARFAEDGEAKIAVLVGEGANFVAGADISEFGKPPMEPLLPNVVAAIEASEKPVVCVVAGATLGGGLELAMGAHYRLALPSAQMGLPETTLGLLPGAGGTQRLPRLIGSEAALDVILGGKRLSAGDALALGLVDRVAEGDAREAGLAFASALLAEGKGPRRVCEMPAPSIGEEAERWQARIAREDKGQVARATALRAVVEGASLPFTDGMTRERELFRELLDTPQRAALVHAFFAERKVSQLPELKGLEARPVSRLGVVGGGTMGAGIAAAALLKGIPVTLAERDEASAQKARGTVAGILDGSVKRGKLTPEKRDSILSGGFETAVGYEALGSCDLAIEAVFEDMAVKRAVLSELDKVLGPDAVIATNTSYLDVDELARATSRPESVIGLHFFSPAHVMRLLEIVVGEKTAPQVVATGFAFAKRLGKVAVRSGVCDGFIGNRILSAYRGAMDRCVLDGASPFAVDEAMEDFGMAMGPYAVADLAGLDIGYANRRRMDATRDPRDRPPLFADRLTEMGRNGRKTGRGYYVYAEGGRTPDPEVEAIVSAVRDENGTSPRQFTAEEIAARALAAMVNEASKILEEGIARRPLDVDIVLLTGYGFPRWRGGPMHHADAVGLPKILADIERFAEEDAFFWSPAPLLRRLVAENRSFADLNLEEKLDA